MMISYKSFLILLLMISQSFNVFGKILPLSSSTSIVSGVFGMETKKSLTEKIPKLPWEASLLFKLFGKDSLTLKKDPVIQIPVNKISSPPILLDLLSAISSNKYVKLASNFFQKIVKYVSMCKGGGHVLIKGLGLAFLGFLAFNKLNQWYQNVGEMEIILDQTDNSYKSFGCNLNGIGVSYLAALNYTAIEELRYAEIFRKLEVAIQIPRFPQSLKEYSATIGREVADLIATIEKRLRIRLHNDFLKYQRLVMTQDEIDVLTSFQHGVVLLQMRQADATLRLIRLQILEAANQCEDLIADLNTRAVKRSQNLRLPIPRFILYHLPGFARGIRASTLDKLRRVVGRVSKTSSRNLPTGLGKGIGKNSANYLRNTQRISEKNSNDDYLDEFDEENSLSVETILENKISEQIKSLHMNNREKVMLLEGLRNSFYQTAGHLQQHLNRASLLRENFISAVSMVATPSVVSTDMKNNPGNPSVNIPTDSKNSNPPPTTEKIVRTCPYFLLPGVLSAGNNLWKEIETWNSQTSTICSEAVLLLTLDAKQFELEGFEIISNLRNKTEKLNKNTTKSSAFVGINGGLQNDDKQPFAFEDEDLTSSGDLLSIYSGINNKAQGHSNKPCETYAFISTASSSTLRIVANSIPSSSGSGSSSEVSLEGIGLEKEKEKEKEDFSQSQENDFIIDEDNITSIKLAINDGDKYGYNILKTLEIPMNVQSLLDNYVLDDDIFSSVAVSQGDSVISSGSWVKSSPDTYSDSDLVWGRNMTFQFNIGTFKLLYTQPKNVQLSQRLSTGTVNNNINQNLSQAWILTQTFNYTEFPNNMHTVICLFEPIQASNNATSSSEYNHTKITAIMSSKTSPSSSSSSSSSSSWPWSGGPNRKYTRASGDYVNALLNKWKDACDSSRSASEDSVNNNNNNENSAPSSRIVRPEEQPASASSSSSSSAAAAATAVAAGATTGNNVEKEKILFESMSALKDQWRANIDVIQKTILSEHIFVERLESLELKERPHKNMMRLFNPVNLLRLSAWSLGVATGYQLYQNPRESQKVLEQISTQTKRFFQMRVFEPVMCIVNDVFFNKKKSLADQVALVDAKRSLGVMLNDFLVQYRPNLSEKERARLIDSMDMTPISQEYEVELRRPLSNILSGRIARLVLIQLQFVKKELLVAMQAIDELFNANQVNLQLLAITPAVLSGLFLQVLLKTFVGVVSYSRRGKFMESTATAHKELRAGIRTLEKILCFSNTDDPISNSPVRVEGSTIEYFDPNYSISKSEFGEIMSVLYRLQSSLVLHHSHFDRITLSQLQEDLRDVMQPKLSPRQRLNIVDRMMRSYPFGSYSK